MEYRENRRTGDKISVIGFGTSNICYAPEKEIAKTLETAFDAGINYFDLATSESNTFPAFGSALSGVRKSIFYQIHFGADYTGKSYGWSLDLERVKRSVDHQLNALKTDYIDYGFIHCIDEKSDWEAYKKNGVLDYLSTLQKGGVVRNIGLSSHNPEIVNLILDEIPLDMIMFSINPAYDYERGDEYGRGKSSERAALYRRIEASGAGISVMKPFCAGQLLSAKSSPFGAALNEFQCIKYALDKPAVLTALCGVKSKAELLRVLGYFDAADEEKDYSIISTFAPAEMNGVCVYCNHCQPCPAGIDIAAVNKYYDLARAGDKLAVTHYKTLGMNAADCVSCGHCDGRCPFHVKQSARMSEIAGYFG